MKKSNYPSVVEVSDLVFQRVYEKNGRILSVCWKNESCSFAFTDCFPEEIIFDKSCSVSYSSRIRTIGANFMVKTEEPEFLDAAFPLSEFKNMLLGSIETAGALAQGELFNFSNIEEFNVKIFIPKHLLAAVLESCARVMDISFWHEKSFSLTVKNDGFFINASFERGIVPSSSVFSLVSSYSEIFIPDTVFSSATSFLEKENKIILNGKKQLLNKKTNFTGVKNEN